MCLAGWAIHICEHGSSGTCFSTFAGGETGRRDRERTRGHGMEKLELPKGLRWIDGDHTRGIIMNLSGLEMPGGLTAREQKAFKGSLAKKISNIRE
eukprot:31916-Eustigmatos_ZCMA.PRE.1